MHMIEAVIKPAALDKVKAKLQELGVQGCTALECKGFGKQKGHTERYRGGEMEVGFIPKILLKIAVRSADRQPVIDAICEAAQTGNPGDGKIFVYALEHVVRVRTGELDGEALQ